MYNSQIVDWRGFLVLPLLSGSPNHALRVLTRVRESKTVITLKLCKQRRPRPNQELGSVWGAVLLSCRRLKNATSSNNKDNVCNQADTHYIDYNGPQPRKELQRRINHVDSFMWYS
jgi:hypothetical protein